MRPIIGPVGAIRVTPQEGIGYSHASFSRVEIEMANGTRKSLVLKRTRLDQSWTARRTGDSHGREAMLLAEPALAPVWDIFDCPYIAFASERGEVGLLMHDLSASLLPDVREPLSDAQEAALLGSLADMHARFWGKAAPALDWLATPAWYCDGLAPAVAADPLLLAVLTPHMQVNVKRGWGVALSLLPAPIARHLTCSGSEWEQRWADLPRTLLHGDAKVANFAILPNGRVSAFDWAFAGVGPCAIDLGWYLAVNATRLTGSKEQLIGRYRQLLEHALAKHLPEELWNRLEEVAVITGARMLLWSKALALESGRPGARDEWDWWAARLAALH